MTNEVLDAIMAEEVSAPKDLLKKISAGATRMDEIKGHITSLEEELASAKKDLRELSEQTIPTLIDAAGIEGVLHNGRKITVKPFYNVTVKTPEQLEWLMSNGYGDIVKTDITITAGKGADQQHLAELMDRAREFGFDAVEKNSVHHATAKVWAREQIENKQQILEDGGKQIPLDLFDVYIGRQTVVK